ncbi:MAG TPA: ROK family protein [Pyrinomonadaceae bacterium]|nr:ROK family protein [Pyrinomonadaceae bacterium]
MMREDALVGAIEGGGTKFVCAVGTGPHDLARTEFPTGNDPARVLAQATDWLCRQEQERGRLHAVGIGSFGPVDLNPDSPAYGHVTATPKQGWNGADVVGPVRRAFPGLAVAFETDVNAAALGEYYWGAAAGLDDFVYVTIGTGIGGGALVGGRLVHGLVHPEMGHMLLPRAAGDTFEGACPYHGPCWEGLCSGPALLKRTGARAEDLAADHAAWAYATEYTALALANITGVLSPRRLIIGGGVRRAGRLGEGQFFRLIREKTRAALNGYLASHALADGIDDYIVAPRLGDDAGVCGAIALAQLALNER